MGGVSWVSGGRREEEGALGGREDGVGEEVIPGEDVVRDGRDAVFIPQRETQLQHQSRFPGSDGSITQTQPSAQLLALLLSLSLYFFYGGGFENESNYWKEDRERLPTDAHGEGSFVPVSVRDDGHLAAGVGAGPVKDLVAVAVFGGVEFVGVGVGVEAIVGVGRCHFHGA